MYVYMHMCVCTCIQIFIQSPVVFPAAGVRRLGISNMIYKDTSSYL